MATEFLFVLFGIAGISLFTRYRKVSISLWLIGLVVFFGLGTRWVTNGLLTPLQSSYKYLAEPTWLANNAIVILGGGSRHIDHTPLTVPTIYSYSRLNQAAQLYFSCKQAMRICTVIISGGDGSKIDTPKTVSYRMNLLRLGVADADLILENKSLNTRDNAKNTSAILNAHHFDYVVLVTSALHMTRARAYFSLYEINAVPAPADYLVPVNTYLPIAYNLTFCDLALHEYIGMLQYYFYKLRARFFDKA